MNFLGFLQLREQAAVEPERRGEVIQRLFVVAVLQIRLSKVGIGLDENEQVFLMNINEHLANRQLLDASLDHFFIFLLGDVLVENSQFFV